MRSLLLCDDLKVEQVAALAKERGVGIEVQSFFDPARYTDNEDIIKIHQASIDGIPVRSLHGPFGDLVPGSFDPEVRALAARRFNQAVEIALKLDIKQVVLHHTYYPGAGPADKYSERFGQFWKEFLEDKPSDLHFHIENIFERDIEQFAASIDAVDDSRVDACLDVGHAHCFSGEPPRDWIRKLSYRIGYVHLHSNDGRHDQHLALGEGTLDAAAVCDALLDHAPEASWAIEAEGDGLMRSLDWLREHGYFE